MRNLLPALLFLVAVPASACSSTGDDVASERAPVESESDAGDTDAQTCTTEGRVEQIPHGSLSTFDECTVCTCTGGKKVCEVRPRAECPLETCATGAACTDANVVCTTGKGKCDDMRCECGADGTLSCTARAC